LGCIATPTKIKLGYQVVLALYIDIVVNRGTKRKLHNVNKDLRKHKSFTTFSDNYFNNRIFFFWTGNRIANIDVFCMINTSLVLKRMQEQGTS